MILYSLEDAQAAISEIMDLHENASEKLTAWAILMQCPPLYLWTRSTTTTRRSPVWQYTIMGVGSDCDTTMAVYKKLAGCAPIGEFINPMPHSAWQTAFDAGYGAGMRNYEKSTNGPVFPKEAVQLLVDSFANGSEEASAGFASMGGAVNRVATDATAYPHRNLEMVVNITTRSLGRH